MRLILLEHYLNPCDYHALRNPELHGEDTWKRLEEHWKLEEVRKDPLLQVLEGTRPCQHLGFGLLAVREPVSPVSHQLVCATLL